MCFAPIGSIPPPIEMDSLGIGIELDISGIGDELRPPAATAGDEWPEPHAAAASASALTPTATLAAEPGRGRPGELDTDMTSSGARTRQTRTRAQTQLVKTRLRRRLYRRPGSGVDCTSTPKERERKWPGEDAGRSSTWPGERARASAGAAARPPLAVCPPLSARAGPRLPRSDPHSARARSA